MCFVCGCVGGGTWVGYGVFAGCEIMVVEVLKVVIIVVDVLVAVRVVCADCGGWEG